MWDATTIVAHSDAKVFVDIDLYSFARIHTELVDRIVNDLFQKHIDSVLRHRTVAQSTDVHTGAHADMFHIRERPDV